MGAWQEQPYENDTAMDWLHGVGSVMDFVIKAGTYSQWNEEVLAAAQLLTDLPERLIQVMCIPFPDLISNVESQLKDAHEWRNPRKRKIVLTTILNKLKRMEKNTCRISRQSAKKDPVLKKLGIT